MSIIEVENVSKVFNQRKRYPGLRGAIKGFFSTQVIKKAAVDNINFAIKQGEIVGYIGPNGAGKSTTIKMLSGILYPTNGTLLVNGIEPYKNRVKNAFNIGVVFGQRTQLWYDIPASESFSLLRYMYKVPEKKFKKTIEIFNDILGIQEFANTPVRQLSLGQRIVERFNKYYIFQN